MFNIFLNQNCTPNSSFIPVCKLLWKICSVTTLARPLYLKLTSAIQIWIAKILFFLIFILCAYTLDVFRKSWKMLQNQCWYIPQLPFCPLLSFNNYRFCTCEKDVGFPTIQYMFQIWMVKSGKVDSSPKRPAIIFLLHPNSFDSFSALSIFDISLTTLQPLVKFAPSSRPGLRVVAFLIFYNLLSACFPNWWQACNNAEGPKFAQDFAFKITLVDFVLFDNLNTIYFLVVLLHCCRSI